MPARDLAPAPATGGEADELATSLDVRVLRYSRVWEDHRLLDAALALDGDSHVLSICSAGCNVLAMLLSEPLAITAVDLSPVQAALLQLQLVAIRRGSARDVRRLLGIDPALPADRLAAYAALRDHLDPRTRAVWDERVDVIAGGLAFSGRLERYIRGFTGDTLPDYVPGDALRQLFTLDEERDRRAWAKRWLTAPGLEAAFRAWTARDTMAARGRDPEQFRWVSDVDVSGQLWDRLRWVCTELPTRGNFYLHAFFFGSYGEALPPHLSDEGHARLAPLVERVKVHVGDLSRLLGERRPGTFTHANLSDMFEYQSPAQSQDAMTRLGENLRGGGRVAFWNFLVARAPGPEQDALVRLDALSDELWRRDRSWFYRAFHVAEVAR